MVKLTLLEPMFLKMSQLHDVSFLFFLYLILFTWVSAPSGRSAAHSPSASQLSLKTAKSGSSTHRPESDVDTAVSGSATQLHGDCPESNVDTAVEPPASEVRTARDIVSGMSTPKDSCCPTSNVETATEFRVSRRARLDQQQQPIGYLQPNPQRSVTEVQASHHRFGQTPENFDSRAASGATEDGNAPTQEPLAPTDPTLKTAVENPSQTQIKSVSYFLLFFVIICLYLFQASSNSSTMGI